MALVSRSGVLALFEACRSERGAPFDESHFLDYLESNPSGVGSVRNSFSGLRRFNRFIDSVQLEYAVCLSMKDRETPYSLDAFVNRLAELLASPRGSLRSLSNQEKAGAGWGVVVVADFVLLTVAATVRHSRLAAVPVVLAIVVTAAFAAFCISAKSYLRQLRRKIEALSGGDVAV